MSNNESEINAHSLNLIEAERLNSVIEALEEVRYPIKKTLAEIDRKLAALYKTHQDLKLKIQWTNYV